MRENKTMRLGLYRKIEIARKQLPSMDEEAFRGLLRAEYGVSSRKDMSVNQLARLVHLFAEMGVTFAAPAKAKNRRCARIRARTGWKSRIPCRMRRKSAR